MQKYSYRSQRKCTNAKFTQRYPNIRHREGFAVNAREAFEAGQNSNTSEARREELIKIIDETDESIEYANLDREKWIEIIADAILKRNEKIS